MELDKGYIGQVLLQRGFKDWFLYMFRMIKGTPFTIDPIHNNLFQAFQYIYDCKDNRVCLNEPPRSGKTTLASFFVVYGLTQNPKNNYIYTSFSQSLLTQISDEIAGILTHPIYTQLYPPERYTYEEENLDPINEFWLDELLATTKKTKYSSRKIVTSQGGVVLFASIGSAITGFGAGQRNAKGFSGALIIDDGNKPDEAHRKVMRDKTNEYYSGTLLSRLNNSNVPVINIQQRIHLEDLTGYLSDVYKFKVCKYPLINDKGECLLPSQYTLQGIEDLKKDNFTFNAQYQQEPIINGGNLIKTAWFVRYDKEPDRFDRMYIVCDTAFTEKKSADNTVFLLCGVSGTKLYILDCYCKKVIFPDMKRDLKAFYSRKQQEYSQNHISAIHIENKGSGISLIQELRNEGLPISELYPTVHNPIIKKDQVTDKYTRFQEISADLESGYCCIPQSANWLQEFMFECEAFDGGSQNAHDDIVDCLIYALKLRRKTGLKIAPNWQDYY